VALKLMMVSWPSSRSTSIILVAMSVSASSQETRFHCVEPRSPTRFIGWSGRPGVYIWSLKAAPFWHPMGLKSGSPSTLWTMFAVCSSRQTIPSRTKTFQEQALVQLHSWLL
jgi:hypothetical protein